MAVAPMTTGRQACAEFGGSKIPGGPGAKRPFVQQQNRDLPRVHFFPKIEGGIESLASRQHGGPSGRFTHAVKIQRGAQSLGLFRFWVRTPKLKAATGA
jgi:hypothetical protein